MCIPSGIVTSRWPSVKRQCAKLGVGFDGWQDGLGALTLSCRKDGQYACSVGGAVMSIPRQTGKTYLVGWMIFSLCIMTPGTTAIWTAHRTRTANETFQAMRTMAKKNKVKPLVEAVRAANGEQAIIFRNGSRILFGAREQGFGRGFAEVDILVLDEGQILTEDAMSDMVPATNAAKEALVLLMGTPPRPKDPGEVFRERRRDGLNGDPDTLYVEFSADEDASLDDWEQLAKANPSFPHRTSKTAILRMRKLLASDENFKREAYGIWDREDGATRAISATAWKRLILADDVPQGRRFLGVVFSKDGLHQAIGGAVKGQDTTHLELIGSFEGPVERGLAASSAWIASRWRTFRRISISGAAGAATLKTELVKRGVPKKRIHILNVPEYFASCGGLLQGVQKQTITHPRAAPGDALDEAIAITDKQARGQYGAWGWGATTPDGDETPVEAISVALWAADNAPTQEGGGAFS